MHVDTLPYRQQTKRSCGGRIGGGCPTVDSVVGGVGVPAKEYASLLGSLVAQPIPFLVPIWQNVIDFSVIVLADLVCCNEVFFPDRSRIADCQGHVFESFIQWAPDTEYLRSVTGLKIRERRDPLVNSNAPVTIEIILSLVHCEIVCYLVPAIVSGMVCGVISRNLSLKILHSSPICGRVMGGSGKMNA